MKIFIYKVLIISFVFALLFELLIGSKINEIKKRNGKKMIKLYNIFFLKWNSISF